MFHEAVTLGFRLCSGVPALRIYGKGRRERDWHSIAVYATHRRDGDSSWPHPFWRGTIITWTSGVIALGWDTEELLREQMDRPASREHPVEAPGGRLNLECGVCRVPQTPHSKKACEG